MAVEKTFTSELPALLTSLFGSGRTSTTSTSTANTGGLQGVYDRAMQPVDYDQLIKGIFSKAAEQIPQLTAALANATGSRSSGNSALALALNEQNNNAGAQAADAIMRNQNQQLQIAGNAAGGIAQATRSTTGTSQQKPALNPLVSLGGGFLLNQADKRGMFKNFMGGGTPTAPTETSSFLGPIASNNIDMGDSASFGNFAPSGGSDFGGFDASSFVSDGGYDFFGGAGGAADLFGGGASISDIPMDDWFLFADGGAPGRPFRMEQRPSFAPQLNNVVLSYADGGMVGPGAYQAGGYGNPMDPALAIPQFRFQPQEITSVPQGFADGGPVRGQGLLKSRGAQIDAGEAAAVSGQDPNAAVRGVQQSAVSVDPKMEGQVMQLLRGYMHKILGVPMPAQQPMQPQPNTYMDGGRIATAPPRGYADGGAVRNRFNTVDDRQQLGTNALAGNSGSGIGFNTISDMITRSIGQQQVSESQETMGDADPALTEGQENSMAADAAGGYKNRDAIVSAFLSTLAGMATAGAFPALAQAQPVTNMLGLTKSPLGFATSMLKSGQQSQALADSNANLALSNPEGSFVSVDPTTGATATNAPQTDILGNQVTPNMSVAPWSGGMTIDLSGNPTAPAAGDTSGSSGSSVPFADGGNTGGLDSVNATSTVPGGGTARFNPGEEIVPNSVVNMLGRRFFQMLRDQAHQPIRR